MNLRNRLDREIMAFKIDREYHNSGRNDFASYVDFNLTMDQMMSIQERYRRVRGLIWRKGTDISQIPYHIKEFVHRGKHGWATSDTWSMDYSLAKMLDGLFTEFLRVNIAYMHGMTFEEWTAIVTEIRDGFRAYHMWQDKDWGNIMDIDERILAKDAEFEDAFNKVKRSFELMSEYYPGLWW